MPAPVSSHEMHAWIEESLGQRSDIGLGKAIVNMLFEVPNPFEARARRKPKVGFVVGAILFAVAASCIWYFNFAPQ
jgi:hypothetical protein